MLFNLNSIDEPNPRNFKNRLSDNIVIKPNSYVCLIGATITRKNYVKKIIFNSAGTCRIKLNNYDVFDITIPAGTYTLLEFCNVVNALFTNYDAPHGIGAICAITTFHVFVGGTPQEEQLEFRMKWKGEDNLNGELFRNLIGQDIYYGQYLARNLFGKTAANVYPNAINGINSVIGGNAGIYTSMPGVIEASSPLNPNGYTIPPNQYNGHALNIGTMPQNDIGNTFFIGQPDLPNIKFLMGRAVYDTANNRYESGANFGGTQWTNPAQTNNCPFYISFKNTGAYDFFLYNTTTNALTQFGTDIYYHPGDLYRFNFVREDHTPLVESRAGSLILHHITGNSNVFFNQLRLSALSSTPQWNSYTPQALDLQEYIAGVGSGAYNFAYYDSFWTGQQAESYTRPIGVRAGTGKTTESNYYDCNDGNGFAMTNTGGVSNITLQTGNSRSWLNGTPYFQRYRSSAAPSVSPDLLCNQAISSNGIKVGAGNPMMFSFYFNLVDDTAKLPPGNNDSHNFLNDSATSQRMVMVRPANVVAHDVETYLGGHTDTFILLNGSGTRINIAYGKDYFMRVSYNGTTHDTYTISIYDIDADDTFSATTAGGGNYFNALGSISYPSSLGAGVNYNHTFNGYFGEFRVHLSCDSSNITPTWWDSTYTDLCSYMRTGNRTMKYWWNFDLKQTYPTPSQYRNIGLINNRATLTPVFDKDTMTIGYDQNWGDFVAPAFEHASYMNNNQRVTNLGVDAYDGDELGLLNVALLDPDGVDDLVFENVDARGNVVVEPNQVGEDKQIVIPDDNQYPLVAQVEDIALEDKTIYVEIPNLPHRSYNGVTKTQDKTIGVVPLNGVNANRLERDNLDVITAYPPTKNWIAFNNPGEIVLNELQVKLSDVRGKELAAFEIAQETAVTIEIEERNNIFS